MDLEKNLESLEEEGKLPENNEALKVVEPELKILHRRSQQRRRTSCVRCWGQEGREKVTETNHPYPRFASNHSRVREVITKNGKGRWKRNAL